MLIRHFYSPDQTKSEKGELLLSAKNKKNKQKKKQKTDVSKYKHQYFQSL